MKNKQTRLDRGLSIISEFYGKCLKYLLLVLGLIEIVEQIVLLTNLDQMIAIFVIGLGIATILLEGIYREYLDKKEKKNG